MIQWVFLLIFCVGKNGPEEGKAGKVQYHHHLCKSSTKQPRNAGRDGDRSHHDDNMVERERERERCCRVGDQALSFYRRVLRSAVPKRICPGGTYLPTTIVVVVVVRCRQFFEMCNQGPLLTCKSLSAHQHTKKHFNYYLLISSYIHVSQLLVPTFNYYDS